MLMKANPDAGEGAPLSPAQIAALACAGAARVDDSAFLEKGYAEAALTVRVTKGGAPQAGVPLLWRILRAENRGPVAPGSEAGTSGLSWTLPAAGRGWNVLEVRSVTDAGGFARAALFDIVGERRVLVRAAPEGATEGRGVVLEAMFGKGPLSRFRKPEPKPLSREDFLALCRKTAKKTAPELLVPTVNDLRAVSLPGMDALTPAARGAALAAGWPEDLPYFARPAADSGEIRLFDLSAGAVIESGAAIAGVPCLAVRLRASGNRRV